MIRMISGALVAAGLLAAPVQAGCWNNEEASAATVRQLQSMLMVAALRCQVSGHDITADYNRFVIANRSAIGAMNDRIKVHFLRASGPVGGQRAYDAFVTRLANGYGAAQSGADACEGMASLAREGSLMAGSADGLLLLAGREGVASDLPDGVCGTATLQIASNAPTGGDDRTGTIASAR